MFADKFWRRLNSLQLSGGARRVRMEKLKGTTSARQMKKARANKHEKEKKKTYALRRLTMLLSILPGW